MQYAKAGNLRNLPLEVNGKIYKLNANLSTGAAIYENVQLQDIYSIFKNLSGVSTLPSTGSPMYKVIPNKYSTNGEKGYVISVKQSDGSTVVLRNFSSSAAELPARYTIEIQKPSGINANKLGLKFK